jgi:hypothetical protein
MATGADCLFPNLRTKLLDSGFISVKDSRGILEIKCATAGSPFS